MLAGELEAPTIAYETWGNLNADRSNAILIFCGLSPSAHAASNSIDPSPGWWEDMIGPNKPIDTRRYFVICANSLGSCFGSTGPNSIDRATGEPYRLTFPILHLEDVANASAQVVDTIGIDQLNCVIGASMGGMSALAYLVSRPRGAQRMISISAAASAQPFAIAMRSLQRELICADPNWQDGSYSVNRLPATGMQLARKLGMIAYRSAREWSTRFGRERIQDRGGRPNSHQFDMNFEIESYLAANAKKFVNAFDANCYLYLSRAIDLFDLASHGGTSAQAIKDVELEKSLFVGVSTDFLFPPSQQQELHHLFEAQSTHSDCVILDSIQGHDSFLVDMDRFRPVIAEFLSET